MSNVDPLRNTPPVAPPGREPPQAGQGDERHETEGSHAKEQGREVAGHARSEMEEGAQTVSDRAGDVVGTAQTEVRDVVDEARDALRQQADRQSEVAAGALGHLRDDLRAMSDGGTPRDATAQYVRQAASTLDDVVGRLESEGVEGALSGVRSFARRSPGGFLLASAGAGFAVGRILRNADDPREVEQAREIDLTASSPDGPASSRPASSGAGLTGGRPR